MVKPNSPLLKASNAPSLPAPVTPSNDVLPAERLLTKEQVCHELGISLNTLTEWMKDGTVPFLRYGRRVYFEWHQLLAAGRANAHQDQLGQ